MPTEPTERPILFSGPMVRAILEGRKTQTRRVIQAPGGFCFGAEGVPLKVRGLDPLPCPYGVPGDRLWVREKHSICTDGETVCYAATEDNASAYQWSPSIHMPRWASRIDLEVAKVRLERVQDITESDAIAEGVTAENISTHFLYPHKVAFGILWNSINDKRGFGWDSNPWVWVIEFRRIA